MKSKLNKSLKQLLSFMLVFIMFFGVVSPGLATFTNENEAMTNTFLEEDINQDVIVDFESTEQIEAANIMPIASNVTGTFDIGTGLWTTPGVNNAAAWNGTVLTLGAGSNVTVTGSTTLANRRIVVSGGNVNLTLVNVNITGNHTFLGQHPLSLQGNANLTLNVTGTNRLINAATTAAGAGIHVPQGTTITIQGSGTLYAEGSGNHSGAAGVAGGAGIGGWGANTSVANSTAARSAGNIIIQGDVTVNASSRGVAAGIGGGGSSSTTTAAGSGGNVTIQGNANVSAIAAFRAAGIGGGSNVGGAANPPGQGGVVTINTTGRVFARGGSTGGAGIGGGSGGGAANGGNGGTINIHGGQITAIGGVGTLTPGFSGLATGLGGAGIGGAAGTSNAGNGGNITITGGTVRAMSNNTQSAGIGGGGGPSGLMGTVHITGGNVIPTRTPAGPPSSGFGVGVGPGQAAPTNTQPTNGVWMNQLRHIEDLAQHAPAPSPNAIVTAFTVNGVDQGELNGVRLSGTAGANNQNTVGAHNFNNAGGQGTYFFAWLPSTATGQWVHTTVEGITRVGWSPRPANHTNIIDLSIPFYRAIHPAQSVPVWSAEVGDQMSIPLDWEHSLHPDAPIGGTVTWSLEGAPSWLSLDSTTGDTPNLIGVPPTGGEFTFDITVNHTGGTIPGFPDGIQGLNGHTETRTITVIGPSTANVHFEFISSDPSQTLSSEVLDLLPASQLDVILGTDVTAPTDFPLEVAVNDPILGRGVWHFDGWHTNSATVVDGDVLFTGTWIWVPNMLTLTFDGNNGSLNEVPESIQVQEGSTADGNSPNDPFPTTEPRRRFYIFTGWNTAPDGSGVEVTAETVILENMTAYAQWIPHMLTVTFDANGGDLDTVPETIEVQRGSSANGINPNDPFPTTIPMPPSIGYGNFSWNDYYVFMGWNTEADGSGVEVTAAMVIMKNITAYAQWQLFPRCNLHEWDPYETYYEGDYVIYQGVIYVALVDWRGQGDLDWRPLLARSVWAPTNHYLHASCAPIVFADPWDSFAFYTTGDFVTFNGRVYRSLHTLQGIGVPDWNPTAVPSMWETTNISITSVRPISERPIPGHIPDWDATRLYFPGDRAFFDGRVYEAIVAVQGRGDLQWNPAMHQSIWRWISDWNE